MTSFPQTTTRTTRTTPATAACTCTSTRRTTLRKSAKEAITGLSLQTGLQGSGSKSRRTLTTVASTTGRKRKAQNQSRATVVRENLKIQKLHCIHTYRRVRLTQTLTTQTILRSQTRHILQSLLVLLKSHGGALTTTALITTFR